MFLLWRHKATASNSDLNCWLDQVEVCVWWNWQCVYLNVVAVQALQFLSKAHRCQVQAGGWEKDPALFKEVLRKALDMGEGTTNIQCPGQLMMIMRMMKIYLHPSFSGPWNNKQWLKGRFIFPVPLIVKGDEALRGSAGVARVKSQGWTVVWLSTWWHFSTTEEDKVLGIQSPFMSLWVRDTRVQLVLYTVLHVANTC